MSKYNSRYQTARAIFSIIEFLGWVVVVIGVMVAIVGFSSGGILGRLSGNTPVLLKLFAMLPGLGFSFFGILSVAVAQVWRSQVDSAEYAREMLQIARGRVSSPIQTHSSNALSETPGQPVSSTAQPIPKGEVLNDFDPKVAIQTNYGVVTTYVLEDLAVVIEDGELWRKFNNVSDADIYINR